jgi:hypothetical protein
MILLSIRLLVMLMMTAAERKIIIKHIVTIVMTMSIKILDGDEDDGMLMRKTNMTMVINAMTMKMMMLG